MDAVETYGLPSCVRCYRGIENFDVAHYMLTHPLCGIRRSSIIDGRSAQSTNRKVIAHVHVFILYIESVHVFILYIESGNNGLYSIRMDYRTKLSKIIPKHKSIDLYSVTQAIQY